MEALSTDCLHEIVQRKLHLLQSIKKLALQQAELVATQDVDVLLSLLARKSEAMEALQAVQQELKPFQSQTADDRVWESIQKREQCQTDVRLCDRLLAELVEMENQSIQALQQDREFIGGQLKTLQSTTDILRAYEANSFAEQEYTPLSLEG